MEYIAVVHCHACDFTSTDVKLTRCPLDHEILGEIMLTREELAARQPRRAYNFAPTVVMWATCEHAVKALIACAGLPVYMITQSSN
jgi:hypothetical protein